MYVCMYVYVYVCMYVFMYVCMYACKVCMYICMYVSKTPLTEIDSENTLNMESFPNPQLLGLRFTGDNLNADSKRVFGDRSSQ